jgi:hypothetical protein
MIPIGGTADSSSAAGIRQYLWLGSGLQSTIQGRVRIADAVIRSPIPIAGPSVIHGIGAEAAAK